MKRGTKLFVATDDGQAAGPFGWTLIREWFAFSYLSLDSLLCVAGQETWQPLSDFADLQTMPKSFLRPPTSGEGATNGQLGYLYDLGCPFVVPPLDRVLAERLMDQLGEEFPDRVDPEIETLRQEAREIAQRETNWRNHPATQPQISCLRAKGIKIELGMTKGRASQLIDGEATEGQLRRLAFYQIEPDQFLTNTEASRIIDTHIACNPDSEALYQNWKKGALVTGGQNKTKHPLPEYQAPESGAYAASLLLAARASIPQKTDPFKTVFRFALCVLIFVLVLYIFNAVRDWAAL